MRDIASGSFSKERHRYALRHACEHCVFFIDESGRCANGYPNGMHREGAFRADGPLDGTFCKEFELL